MTTSGEKRNPGGTHKTPAGSVVWIPERENPLLEHRNAVATAVAGAVLIAMVVLWPTNNSGEPVAAESDSAATVSLLAPDTSIHLVPRESNAVLATVPPIPPPEPEVVAVSRPVMMGALANAPAPRRPAYEDIKTDPERRAALRDEIARCKDPSAVCSVDHVVRMASELVQIRKRMEQARLLHLAAGK